jgi:succinate dehydrogenase/fumarate reductase flavoprotein subunit
MAGAEIIAHLEQLIQTYVDEEQVTIFTDTRVTTLLQDQNHMKGVQVQKKQGGNNSTWTIHAPQVVLATGGFASDRRLGSILGQVRPDLLQFGTTGGSFSTGDGIKLATQLGANTVDLNQVQLHPTGFIDQKHPNDGTKILAAELLRGVGAILLNSDGER